MPLGLSGKFDILQSSPHDLQAPPPLAGAFAAPVQHWVPSRYNVRATAEDGRLVLWNTFHGSMSVFRPEQAPHVLGLLSRQVILARKEGLVEYLVDRGFLLRKGNNEYRQVQVAIHQQQYRTDRLN